MKKNNKLVTILLASSLLLPGIAPLATGVTSVSAQQGTEIVDRTFDAKYVTVIGQVLRNVPNDQSSTNGYVAAEETVEFVRAIRSSDGKSWFEVKYDDKQGYVLSGDVTSVDNFNDDSEAEIHNVPVTQEAGAKAEYVIASTTALRTKDENNYRPVRVMDKGERVSYKGTTANDWFMVEDKDGQLGYIYRGDVTSVKNFEEEGIVDIQDAEMGTAEDFDQLEVVLDVSLRSFDESNYRPIMDLQRGDIVDYVGTTVKDWFKVKTESGQVGYVYRGHVTAVEEEEALAVESVSAINAKTLSVTFNQEVEETGKAKFEVKRGASKLSPEVTWNADKTEAHLELSGKLRKGTYEVAVTGLAEEALTGSTEVENETVAEVKVLTTEAPIKDDSIEVSYQFLNQYGEDITDTNIGTAKVTSTRGTAGTPSKGKVTISGVNLEEKLTVVVLDEKTGKSATGSVEVVDKAILDTIELGDVYNAKDEVLSEDNQEGQYVLVSGKDQYGNDFKLTDKNITVISTKQEVAGFGLGSVEIDDKNVQAFKIDVKKEGSTTLRVVSNNSGKSVDKEITVEAGVKTDTVTFGEVEGTVSGSKKMKLPVEIVNNKGELVTDAKDAKDVTVSVSDVASATEEIQGKDGELYVEFTTNSVNDGKVGTVVVTITTGTNETETKVLTVQPDAVKTELAGVDSKVSFDVQAGRTLIINKKDFIVNDQYGDRIKYDSENYDIKPILKDPSTFVTATHAGETIEIESKANSKNETVEFKLVDVEPESSIEKRVTVVTESEFDSYEVEDIGLVQVHAKNEDDNTKDVLVKDIDLTVKAKTAAGNVVTLTEEDYTVDGVVETTDAAVEFADEKDMEVTHPITITINATGETIEKEVTYSRAVAKVQEFFFTKAAKGTAPKEAKEYTKVLNVSGTVDKAAMLRAVTTDQYGEKAVANVPAAAKLTIVPTDVSKVKILQNGSADANATLVSEDADATAEMTVKVTIGNVTEEIKVTQTK